MRDELHQLVDQLPEEQLAPVLQLIRRDEHRTRAVATLRTVQQRMSGVTGVDEELCSQAMQSSGALRTASSM